MTEHNRNVVTVTVLATVVITLGVALSWELYEVGFYHSIGNWLLSDPTHNW